MFITRLLVALALWLAPGLVWAQSLTLLGAGSAGSVPAGTPLSLTVSSSLWTSITDVTPSSQFVNGWTGDLTIKGMINAGVTANYNFGTTPTASSNKLSFVATSPGFDSTGAATTVARTIFADWWLRQTYNNGTLPTEAANSGNGQFALAFSDWAYSADTLSTATSVAGLYTNGTASTAASGILVTNNSTLAYPPAICTFVTPPGQWLSGTSGFTVEIFCGHARGQGGVPVAAVSIKATDNGGHTVTHTVSTPTLSAVLLSTTCTATNGSATLTGCASTAGFQTGMRLSVPGTPGQPKIISTTSSTIVLGQSVTMTSTANGAEKITATPGTGEVLADGAFLGATITNANLTTNPATIVTPTATCTSSASTTMNCSAALTGQMAIGQFITGTGLTAGDYITACPAAGCGSTGAGVLGNYTISTARTVSGTITGQAVGGQPQNNAVAPATGIYISTNSAIGAGTAVAGTIDHVYQGSTGTVTVTSGDPVPVYSANFTAGDFSGTLTTDGPIAFEAIVYPVIGNITLDTINGADGTGCDWFYLNVNSGVCSSSSAAWFGTGAVNNAKVVSVNLHNLWEYLDAATSYQPAYVFVLSTGTCTTSACVATSNAYPSGSTANFVSTINQAGLSLKSFYNTRSLTGSQANHNNLAGGVICLTPATYTTRGGAISGLGGTNLPALTITSTAAASACPAPMTLGGAPATTTLGHDATNANDVFPANTNVNNLTISDTLRVVVGSDSSVSSAFPVSEFIFNGDIFVAGATSPLTYQIGAMRWYNSLIDEHAFDGNAVSAFGGVSNTASFVGGSTLDCGSYATNVSVWVIYNALGNVSWNCKTRKEVGPQSSTALAQPISQVIAYNKFMGQISSITLGTSGTGPTNSLLLTHNVCEYINGAQNPCIQISADNDNAPAFNVVRVYNTTIGGRTNVGYEECTALSWNPQTSNTAGSLSTSTTYTIQITYSAPGGSTESTTCGTTTVATGTKTSITVNLQPDYLGRKAWVYVDTIGTPAHIGSIAGPVDQAGVLIGPSGLLLTILANATARANPGLTLSFNVPKTQFMQRFNADMEYNTKGDYYAAAGGFASGARVSAWDARFAVGSIGNMAVTGSTINGRGIGIDSGLGDYFGWNGLNGTSATNLGLITYTSDRSYGNSDAANTRPVYPALNLGMGDYCPTAGVANQVPAGFAAWPWDIQGNLRKNDGTGYAGALEAGCK